MVFIKTMTICMLTVLLSMVTFTIAVNKPIYKVVLSQKGVAQFIQYDVETPPLREFTFCTWLRIYDLTRDQTIFTYVVEEDRRMVRVWLESGGQIMKVMFNGKHTSSIPVEIIKDVWRHVCLSYQSDYGAWALYLDARLVNCETSRNLEGFVLPGGGSFIIGYGISENGSPQAIEGEIFGANMILRSTIERNYTMQQDPIYAQKIFIKNKIRENGKNSNGYIILSDLKTDEVYNSFEKVPSMDFLVTTTNKYVQFKNIPAMSNRDISTAKKLTILPKKAEIIDFPHTENIHTTSDNINFWNLVNQARHEKKFNIQKNGIIEPNNSGGKGLLTVSEYETPPPPGPPNLEYIKLQSASTNEISKHSVNEPSDKETPPPVMSDNKVYGQWTSSNFAGNVLNYLKSIKFNGRENRKWTPPTIPLHKISDSLPYASEFRSFAKIQPPSQFQRRNFIENTFTIHQRKTHLPQINVQVLEDDLRNTILKRHAQTRVKNVEVTNRGQNKKKEEHRVYRYLDSEASFDSPESDEDEYKPRPFTVLPKVNGKQDKFSDIINVKTQNLFATIPFLPVENFSQDSENIGSEKIESGDIYTNMLSNDNKWHNVKSYNNKYNPRQIETEDILNKDTKGNHLPAVTIKYKENSYKFENDEDLNNWEGQILEKSSNFSQHQHRSKPDSVPPFNYNHKYLLSSHDKTDRKKLNNEKSKSKSRKNGKNEFNKQIKIGNALNERDLIGENEEQKKKSFVGGYENIPDINKYRSDIDHENVQVPPSLGLRACRNIKLYDRVLYVQPDQSIDFTHMLLPLKKKNIGIEFVDQNYKKCSLAKSNFAGSELLYIDWNNTPVKLFGGAYPKTTTDLCGFF